MATMQFNATQQRRVPVNRNSLFYSPTDLEYEKEIAMDYIFMDMHQQVVLYQVDYTNTNQDAVYGETDSSSVEYKTPVEVPCIYEIAEPELKSYDKTKSLGTYQKTGKLTITVCQDTLDELGCDFTKGDYVGVQINPSLAIYFTVANEGRNNYDNKHTVFGTTAVFRTILCTPVDTSEFTA